MPMALPRMNTVKKFMHCIQICLYPQIVLHVSEIEIPGSKSQTYSLEVVGDMTALYYYY